MPRHGPEPRPVGLFVPMDRVVRAEPSELIMRLPVSERRDTQKINLRHRISLQARGRTLGNAGCLNGSPFLSLRCRSWNGEPGRSGLSLSPTRAVPGNAE